MNLVMRVEAELNKLLWQWGRARTSENLGVKNPPTFKWYVAPGFPEPLSSIRPEEVDQISDIIDEHLNRRQVESLKCKYRYTHKGAPLNKRRSAKHMQISEKSYREYFKKSIQIIEYRLAGNAA